jgi:hypothetical protein
MPPFMPRTCLEQLHFKIADFTDAICQGRRGRARDKPLHPLAPSRDLLPLASALTAPIPPCGGNWFFVTTTIPQGTSSGRKNTIGNSRWRADFISSVMEAL